MLIVKAYLDNHPYQRRLLNIILTFADFLLQNYYFVSFKENFIKINYFMTSSKDPICFFLIFYLTFFIILLNLINSLLLIFVM